jgi:uncharacterized tellurite resistance protein B-like protein
MMLEAIKSFFHSAMLPAESHDDPHESQEDIRLAACALLLEVAHADDEFTESERRNLEASIRRQFGMDHEHAERLLELAEGARRQAVDLWQFTNLIADHYSLGQKTVLVEMMWAVVYADGRLASREDYLMHKISHLLRLEPGYLAEARRRVEDRAGGGAE